MGDLNKLTKAQLIKRLTKAEYASGYFCDGMAEILKAGDQSFMKSDPLPSLTRHVAVLRLDANTLRANKESGERFAANCVREIDGLKQDIRATEQAYEKSQTDLAAERAAHAATKERLAVVTGERDIEMTATDINCDTLDRMAVQIRKALKELARLRVLGTEAQRDHSRSRRRETGRTGGH